MRLKWGFNIKSKSNFYCVCRILTIYFVLLKIGVLTVQDKINFKKLTKNTINECFHLNAIILFNKAQKN